MSRYHPSWPSPLLALDPIRLRPMGWLDDLLPMRPPSLWRDRSLHARALRWQPDMADLSWLFDAYAMLGIEMPPPRIEHRTHQRSQQRGRLQGGAKQTQLRRRRTPVKGANRPLAIPRWSSPPQMIAPTRGETQARVDSTPAFKARKTVAPENLAKLQWRSPERSAPTPTLGRFGSSQVTPSMTATQTFLRKEETSIEPMKSRSDNAVDSANIKKESPSRSVGTEKIHRSVRSVQEVLAPRRPKIQPYPRAEAPQTGIQRAEVKSTETSPPPKVTWQREHQRSPWRLNQTGRTLLNPQRVIPALESTDQTRETRRKPVATTSVETPSQIRASQIVRIGRAISKIPKKDGDSTEIRAQIRPRVQQVEWTPVRKGMVQAAVLEQGKVRAIAPVVQMDLPPSPRSADAIESSIPASKPSTKESLPAQQRNVQKREEKPEPIEPKRQKPPSIVESVLVQPGRTTLQRQSTQGIDRPQSLIQTEAVSRKMLRETVQVPPRVPWRLKPSTSVTSAVQNRAQVVPDSSTHEEIKRNATPADQQTFRARRNAVIPQVQSWFRPERQRLIEHFQTQRAQKQRERQVLASATRPTAQAAIPAGSSARKVAASERATVFPTLTPNYNFASVGTAAKGVFKVQDQTMVAPIQSGTLVFPTPSVQESTRDIPAASASQTKTTVAESRKASEETIRPKKVNVDTPSIEKGKKLPDAVSQESLKKLGKQIERADAVVALKAVNYAEPYVQEKSVYKRISLKTPGTSWRLKQKDGSNESVSPVTRFVQQQSNQVRWRLPQLKLDQDQTASQSKADSTTSTVPTRTGNKSFFRAPSTFWQGAFSQHRSSVQLQSPMVYTAPSVEQDARSQGTSKPAQSPKTATTKTSGVSTDKSLTKPISRRSSSVDAPRWIPKQVLDVNAPLVHRGKAANVPDVQPEVTKSRIQRSSTPVRSVSWSKRPSFPDPFVAHRQTLTAMASSEVASKSLRTSMAEMEIRERNLTAPESFHSQRTIKAAPLVGGEQTPLLQKNPVQPENVSNRVVKRDTLKSEDTVGQVRKTPRISTDSSVRSANLQAPKTIVDPVRRVSAPSLSASLVYNARVESVASERKVPSPQPSTDSDTDRAIAFKGSQQTRDTADPVRKETQKLLAKTESNVRKTVQQLVRRLPQTQQALLRSKISLPTNWARKLGLAPTAEVKMGWRLQRTLRAESEGSSSIVTPTMPNVGTQQFVLPSSEQVETVRSKKGDSKEESAPVAQKTGRGSGLQANQPEVRSLSSAQVNRIIERQVSFFRSAQRQSFLKAAQMTGGTAATSVPSPARGGLQQVTGEMRKALQRMVFSSDAQPVFLDSVPSVDATVARVNKEAPVTTESTVVSPKAKSNSTRVEKRLRSRTPQWRPGVHTPAPRPKYGAVSKASTQSVSPMLRSNTGDSASETSVSAQSIVPNVAPMTMLQVEDAQSQPDSIKQGSVQSTGGTSTTQSKQTTSSLGSPARSKNSRGRSAPLAPTSLMGRSEVGVFLQPKKKNPLPDPEIPKSKPQSPSTVDSQADVFMVDPRGNLLTGEAAKKRLKELGFARSESKSPKPKASESITSGSYTWEAPAEMMEEAVKQVRKELVVEEKVKESSKPSARPPRQSVIKEWTEEQLLTILVELASSSPEANALLRDVQERVEEYFDLERFRKI